MSELLKQGDRLIEALSKKPNNKGAVKIVKDLLDEAIKAEQLQSTNQQLVEALDFIKGQSRLLMVAIEYGDPVKELRIRVGDVIDVCDKAITNAKQREKS
jgi:hypothetical protein